MTPDLKGQSGSALSRKIANINLALETSSGAAVGAVLSGAVLVLLSIVAPELRMIEALVTLIGPLAGAIGGIVLGRRLEGSAEDKLSQAKSSELHGDKTSDYDYQ